MDFNNSQFNTEYSFSSARIIIRNLSDAFSKINCNYKEAPKYAAKMTEGRCLYCGQPLYSLEKNIPVFYNNLHYDHIYPASKFNLFEVGNIALACQTCNLAKSNRSPIEYYDIRSAEGSSLYIYDREEFIEFLNKMTLPYAKKWPKYYEVNFMELNDYEFKEKLTELLYNPVDISAMSNRYNHTCSVNWPTWEKVLERAQMTYTPLTSKDVEGRLGYANEIFEYEFGVTKLLTKCNFEELQHYANVLLISKYDSKNEIQKFRMLIKMLIETLASDIKGLENFYSTVPTYSQIKVDK